MIELPDDRQLTMLRDGLAGAGYYAEGIRKALGSVRPPRPGEEQALLFRTRDRSAENAMLRLFLVGASLDEETARQLLPTDFRAACLDLGLLEAKDGMTRSNVVIVPVEDLLFVSDAFHVLGSERAHEFVLPASTHSAQFLRHVTRRDPVDTTLDLGCGCGIQALFAARHSRSVVATDISARAVRYTAFNARLNGLDNVECLRGSLFGPVEGRRFDLIVSNPPFVIGPGEDYVYRDNRLELDELVRELVREAPGYLTEGGHLQMLAEWVEFEGEPWSDRVEGWVDGTGCDTWILKSPPRRPVEYVAQRAGDVTGPLALAGRPFADWVNYFRERKVAGIHPGMILLRRRPGPNWYNVLTLTGDVTGDCGAAVTQLVEASDFLDACDDAESLEAATLEFSPALELEQRLKRTGDDWEPARIVLRTTDGLPNDAEIDVPILAFLDQLDGRRSVGEVLDDFCAKTGADRAKLGPEMLGVIRLFVARGFLEPASLDG